MSNMTYSRELRAPSRSFFLFGARGTGKSTWAAQAFPDAERFDLRDETLYQDLLRQPGLFSAMLRRVTKGRWVVVDEIQRLPVLLNEVHRSLDDREHRFVLLGSSARKLRKAGQNLLGGRASSLAMMPFTPSELGSDFELNEVLSHGSIPLVWAEPDRVPALIAYAQTYLREEIL